MPACVANSEGLQPCCRPRSGQGGRAGRKLGPNTVLPARAGSRDRINLPRPGRVGAACLRREPGTHLHGWPDPSCAAPCAESRGCELASPALGSSFLPRLANPRELAEPAEACLLRRAGWLVYTYDTSCDSGILRDFPGESDMPLQSFCISMALMARHPGSRRYIPWSIPDRHACHSMLRVPDPVQGSAASLGWQQCGSVPA